MGVILRYNLATHKEQTSKVLCVKNPNFLNFVSAKHCTACIIICTTFNVH